MKTLLSVFMALTLVCLAATSMTAQVKKGTENDGKVVLATINTNNYATRALDGMTSIPWKNWAGTWRISDTTKCMFIHDLPNPLDTLIVPYITTDYATAYKAAISVQFGNSRGYKTAVLIDSLVKVGGTNAPGMTAKDSVVTGRSIWWMLTGAAGRGCDRVRLIVKKDTAETVHGTIGTTNSTTGTYEVGIVRRPKAY